MITGTPPTAEHAVPVADAGDANVDQTYLRDEHPDELYDNVTEASRRASAIYYEPNTEGWPTGQGQLETSPSRQSDPAGNGLSGAASG
jgi:hypothetical protein